MTTFDMRDIRPSMDVYTLDNVYLGTVLDIYPGTVQPDASQLPPSALQSSQVNGEMLGPMPTRPLGNLGPITQSAAQLYASQRDEARLIGQGAIRVGKWWGLRARRLIPLDLVQTVSLERVVLKVAAEQLG